MPAPPPAFSAHRGARLQAHSLEAARRLPKCRHLARVGVRIAASAADAAPRLDYLWPQRNATPQWMGLHQDIRRLLSATQRLLQHLWQRTQLRERQRRSRSRPVLAIGSLTSGGRYRAIASQSRVFRVAAAATPPRHVRLDAALPTYRHTGAAAPALPAMRRLSDPAPVTHHARTLDARETVAVRSGRHRRPRLMRVARDRDITPTTSHLTRPPALRVAAAMQAPGTGVSAAAPRDGRRASGATPTPRRVLLRNAAKDRAATGAGIANRMHMHAGTALQPTSRTATLAFAGARPRPSEESQAPSQAQLHMPSHTLSLLAPPAAQGAAAALRTVTTPARPQSGTATGVRWIAAEPTSPAAPHRAALPRSASTTRPPVGAPWPEQAALGISMAERVARTPARTLADPLSQTRAAAVRIGPRASHAAPPSTAAPAASGTTIAIPAAAASVSIDTPAPAQALQRYAASAAQALAYRRPPTPGAAQWAHDTKRIEHSVQTQVVRELLQQRHGQSLQAAVANALLSPQTVKQLVRQVQAALAHSDRVERYRKAVR
ncbi:hypothetical protein NRY95_11015 [Xanthomonas campestris pv. phormiicola]|nr:hypothetical protein NRY95_11015 [Xanthomonas campestris pv. phormiicola]